ncbi:MAG: phosphatidate cytidylyltransferase [Dehalococcoidia bacterium]|nr:phosphatidate cytidylyltransferase [Dehalococcoidia bacterium]
MSVAIWQSVLVGAAVGVAAQLGDLAESRLKRASGVKDAGSLLPGHGGILDRLDSIVFALPVVYYLVALVLKPSG